MTKPSLTGAEKAQALAGIGLSVFPCRPEVEEVDGVLYKAKTPRTRRGHLEATTDPAVITAWWRRWPDSLVGVHAGESGLVTADIDMGDGHDGWFSLSEAGIEPTPTQTYKTRRGGDHFVYLAPPGLNLGPTQNHVTPDGVTLADVDRRGGSSFFIWWGEEIPADRTVFRPAPDWLLTPAVEPEQRPFHGDAKNWLEAYPPSMEPSQVIRDWVRFAIPAEDFGHGRMIELQREVVGYLSEGESGAREALYELRRQWLRGVYDTPDFAKDFDQSLVGAIGKFGALPQRPEITGVDLADHAVTDGIPAEAQRLAVGKPEVDDAAAVSDWRVKLLKAALSDESVSDQQAVTLAWHSAVGAPLRPLGPVGVERLWREVDVARRLMARESLAVVTPGVKPIRFTGGLERLSLLSDEERSFTRSAEWFGSRYLHQLHEIMPVMNEPHFRTNRWILLALTLGGRAVIPDAIGRDLPLNLYVNMLGETGSGKTESLAPLKGVIKRFYAAGNSPNLGGKATAEALNLALIKRDGQTTWFQKDEAHGDIREMKKVAGPYSNTPFLLTEVYDGDVPAVQQATRQEVSGIHAKTHFNITFTGTVANMARVMEPEDWESGFLNRFVWSIGDDRVRTKEAKRFRTRAVTGSAGDGSGGNHNPDGLPLYGQWAAELGAALRKAGVLDGHKHYMVLPEDVLDRHADMAQMLEDYIVGSPWERRLVPTFGRLSITILKCACLVALSEGRTRVVLQDLWIAMEQAEEWAANILQMAKATDESLRTREVNEIERFIQDKGGQARMVDIHRLPQFANRRREVADLIEELIAQERVTNNGGVVRVAA